MFLESSELCCEAYLPNKPLQSSDAGFSVLEVIVGLVIFSLAVIPLLDTQFRIQEYANAVMERDQQTAAYQNIDRFLMTVNPAQIPTGRFKFSEGNLRWSSEVIFPDAVISYRFQDKDFLMQYYELTLQITFNGRETETIKRPAIGWGELSQ